MGNINGVPGGKMTIWCNYRFILWQINGIFYLTGLNFNLKTVSVIFKGFVFK